MQVHDFRVTAIRSIHFNLQLPFHRPTYVENETLFLTFFSLHTLSYTYSASHIHN